MFSEDRERFVIRSRQQKKRNLSIIVLVFCSIVLLYGIIVIYVESTYIRIPHVEYMEEKGITCISDSNGGDYVYCIAKDGKVYELKDNALAEKSTLSRLGVKKIISNRQGTFVLTEGGSLLSYCEDADATSTILNAGECVDVINCDYYYAALLSTNELLLSWDIADDEQDSFEDAEMTKIPLKTKAVKLSSIDSNLNKKSSYTTFMKYVVIVDENSDLWLYGGPYFSVSVDDVIMGLYKTHGFGKPEVITEGCGRGIFYKTIDDKLMFYGWGITDEILTKSCYSGNEENLYLHGVAPNVKINDVVQIKANNKGTFFLDSNNKVYAIFNESYQHKFYKLAKFKDKVAIYPNNYDIYAISDKGDVYAVYGKAKAEKSAERN